MENNIKERKRAQLDYSQETEVPDQANQGLTCYVDISHDQLWARNPTRGSSSRTWRGGDLIPANNVQINPSHELADAFRSLSVEYFGGEVNIKLPSSCICLQGRQINCTLGLEYFLLWLKEL